MKYQKKILASVIIVNFNNAKYLTDSLKSVFNPCLLSASTYIPYKPT